MPAFKMITVSEKDLGRIAANAGAHAATIAQDLTATWRDWLPKGQKVINIQQLQLCVRDDLRRLREEIAEIERHHIAELVTDRLSRRARDATVPQLRQQLISAKSIFDGSFGAGTSIKVFGEANLVIPTDPFALRRVGFLVRDNLMDPEMVLPPMQVKGVTIAPLDLAKGFRAPLDKLDAVLLKLEETLPVTNATLERKIKKLAESRQRAGVCARFLEALYYLANHEEIAKRVRQSAHRARDAESDEGGNPAPVEAAVDSTSTESGATPGEPVDSPTDGPSPDDAGGAGALPAPEAGGSGDQSTDEERAALPRAA